MDAQQPQRRMTEISHLFLSDVRAKHTGQAPAPVRKPPGTFKADVSIDMTPEEFAASLGAAPAAEPELTSKPVQAVIAHHLGEAMSDAVRDYAGQLCASGGRVGLIYASATDVRLCCIERNDGGVVAGEVDVEPLDAERLDEALIELDHDVEQWLIVLPDPRCADSRELLKQLNHWTLLTAADHDAVVTSYRTLKGLADLGSPKLSIAICGDVDEGEVDKTFRKLATVCEQFLKVNVSLFGAVTPAEAIAEHVVLHASAADEDLTSPQWSRLAKLAQEAGELVEEVAPVIPRSVMEKPVMKSIPVMAPAVTEAPVAIPTPPAPAAAPTMTIAREDDYSDILELPTGDTSSAAIIAAVVRGDGELSETPVKAPAHAEAALAVSREHGLVMVAVAKPGLSDLRTIGQAYRWMIENQALISMALPQFAVDAGAQPTLRLLVDQSDLSAAAMHPLLAAGNVSVQAYRKLRWAGRTGLLLQAA
ncbi:MAG TPA: hypothetical protein VGB55_10660 [Tepidisphaeraceae bacterium]|jgi:hypothetical protein